MIGQLLTWVGGLFAIGVTLILAPFATALFLERARHLAYWIVDRTADRQPSDIREERRMEWRAHVHDVEGDAWKLAEAMRLAMRFMVELPDMSAVRSAMINLRELRDALSDRVNDGIPRWLTVLGFVAAFFSIGTALGDFALRQLWFVDLILAAVPVVGLVLACLWAANLWRNLVSKREDLIRTEIERSSGEEDQQEP